MAASGNILWTLSLLHTRMMNRVIVWYVLALQRLFHYRACVSFLSISFFFSYFFCFTTCLCIEVSLSILKIKQWSGSYIRKWSFQGWVPSALLNITNVIDLVPFGKKLGYILLPLTSLELLAVEYLRETNISNFIYHLLMITCSLHALKKSPKRKEMRIKNEKVQVLQQTIYSRKETWK